MLPPQILFSDYSQLRKKRLKLKPGDCGGMSAAGSEFTLSNDVRMCNQAGDLLELRTADRALVTQATHLVESSAGMLRLAGPARRGAFSLGQREEIRNRIWK